VAAEALACSALLAAAAAAALPAGPAARRRSGGDRVSAVPHRRADTIAGFLCAFSLAVSGIALVRDPGLLAPVAIVLALVAARMTEAHRTLAAIAVGAGGVAFVLGMIVAIWTDHPLF
jgi:hypothetical protein